MLQYKNLSKEYEDNINELQMHISYINFQKTSLNPNPNAQTSSQKVQEEKQPVAEAKKL